MQRKELFSIKHNFQRKILLKDLYLMRTDIKKGLLQVVTPIIIRSVFKFSISYQPSRARPAALYHEVER